MSRTRTAFLALVVGALLAASPAFASEASDAHKQAMELKALIKKGADETAKAEATKNFQEFSKAKAAVLAGQKSVLSKLDLMYLGLIQGFAGETEEGLKSLREAVNKKEESKYEATIHLTLVQGLIDAGQPDGAAEEVTKMFGMYAEAKEMKTATMNLGMAYRTVMKFEKSAEWLQKAFDLGNTNATKPLVNSLLMAGKKDAAIAAAQQAIDKGIPQQKEDMETLKAIVEKIDTDVSSLLTFDAFVPAAEPDMKDKVVVLGFWNVSSKTFKNTLKLLDSIKKGYKDDVFCVAATTYYKKNAESGKIEEGMSPETERGFGQQLVDQEDWRGWLGYLKDESFVKGWGVSALPHFVVVSKERKLLFAHTMDFSGGGETDIRILKKVIEDAIGQ